MITLGLDMSTKKSGYALFDGQNLIDYGLWQIETEDWRGRVLWMSERLDNFIKTHKIDQIFIEDVPLSNKNPMTLKMLSALQGSVLTVCKLNDIKCEFIGVSQWRSALGLFTGTRNGTKREEMKKSSIEYANKTFGLNLIYKSPTSKFNSDDISDAINVAWSQIRIKPTVQFGRSRKVVG